MLLNTSFNENEPIVRKPEEAIECLLRTDMDSLYINNFLIKKEKMMINFLIDSRYGGPQMIHDHLKKKYLKNIKTIYFDKKNKNLNFYNFKKKFRFLFLVDVILNLLILLKNKKNLSAHNFFFVYSIVNIVPVIFGILEKKK